MATTYTFRGIAPGQRRTGLQTLQDIEGVIGRQATTSERQQLWDRAKYADPTGAAEIDADTYNDLMQWGAGQIPGGAGTYQPWANPSGTPTGGPDPFPTSGPLLPQPFKAPEWLNAPTYERRAYTPYAGPTREQLTADPSYQFVRDQALGAVEGAAGAAGMSRSSRKFGAMADLASGLASREYDKVYGRGLDEHRYGYETGVAGDDINLGLRVADWEGRNGANQRNAELNFDRDWQRELYGRDDDRTRHFFNVDDAWRRYSLEEQRRQFLATLGKSSA